MCVAVFVNSVMLSWFLSDETAYTAGRKSISLTAQNIKHYTVMTAALDNDCLTRSSPILRHGRVVSECGCCLVENVSMDAVW